MFTRARLYALPYPFSQASHASALLYCNNRIYDLLKSTTASACSSTVVSSDQATKKKNPQQQLHDANLDSKNRRGELKSVTVQKTWRARQESFRRCKTQRKIWIVDPQFSRAKHGNHLIGVASRNIWHQLSFVDFVTDERIVAQGAYASLVRASFLSLLPLRPWLATELLQRPLKTAMRRGPGFRVLWALHPSCNHFFVYRYFC